MGEILYRIAKPSDREEIANVHHSVREQYNVGIFSRLGKSFLRQYYKILLDDPYEVVICAEKDGKIIGFSSFTLDARHQMSQLKSHKMRLTFGAIPSIIRKPLLLKDLWQRYRSIKGDSEMRFVHTEGARDEYWAWNPKHSDPLAAVEMDDIARRVLYALGMEEVFFEVDAVNKNVLKLHKVNKAEELERIVLPDNRERVLLRYDLKAKYSPQRHGIYKKQ